MGYVRSHKFCCCLPVRLGVFVMSLGSILLAGFIAICGWVAVSHLKSHELILTNTQRTQLFIQAGISTFFTLAAILGFIGCLTRKRALVSAYSSASITLLGASVVSGAIFLWSLYHQSEQDAIDQCIKNSSSNSQEITKEVCEKGTKILAGATKGIITAIFVIFWLITLYGCVIISSYVSQLEEEEQAKEMINAPPPTFVAPPQPAYAPTYAFNPMGPGQSQYAFTSSQNAYGRA